MKISDRELREIVENRLASIDGNGAPELATELLTLRREVRRLRRAIIVMTKDRWEHGRDCECALCAALKPKRGAK